MSPTTTLPRQSVTLRWVALGILVLSLAACRPTAPQLPRSGGIGASHTTTTSSTPTSRNGNLRITVRRNGQRQAGVNGWAFPTGVNPQVALDRARSFTTDASGHATIRGIAGRWSVQAWGRPIVSPSDPLCARGVEDQGLFRVVPHATRSVTLDLEIGPLSCSIETTHG